MFPAPGLSTGVLAPNETIEQAKQRVLDNESDYYAALIFLVVAKIVPEKAPRQIANAVLEAYKELEMD